jgi:hypothetical protein
LMTSVWKSDSIPVGIVRFEDMCVEAAVLER